MLRKYQKLFQVDLKHNFFADNFARDLNVEPTEATRQLMRKHALLFQASGASFSLSYGFESNRLPILAMMSEDLIRLRFVLSSINPYFLNITDIPFFNTYAQRIYLHNLGKTADDGPISLSLGPTVNADDLLPSDAEAWDAPLDAAHLGVIDLYIGNKDGDNPHVKPPSLDINAVRPTTHYHATFTARATHWRYYIVQKPPLSFDRFEVVDGRSPLEFREEAPHTLRGTNQVATTLTSAQTFMLQERQALKPKLKLSKLNGNGTGSPDISTTFDLPTPDWKRISPIGSGEDQQVYSDMYVFL